MQININKKSGILIAITVALLLIIAFVVFGFTGDRDGDRDQMGMHGQSQGQMMNSGNSTMTANEIMFAQMMIPHHQQAIKISDLAIKISKNNEVLNLAKQIKSEQAPEITQMRAWLTAANASETMDHSMGMGGMLTDSEITTLAKSSGKNFDASFLNSMIAHHEGAIKMVMMIEDSDNSEVKALGESIVKSQSAEIVLMKDLIKKL